MTRRDFVINGIAVVLLLLLLGIGSITVATRPELTTVRIKVSGPAGRKVEASLDVDGENQKEVGVIPTEFVVKGYSLSFEVSGPADEKFMVQTDIVGQGGGAGAEGFGIIQGGVLGGHMLKTPRAWMGRHPDDR